MSSICKKCQGSGSIRLEEGDYCDCTYCDAAEQRVELARFVSLHCQHLTREQRDWEVFQHAARKAALQEREACAGICEKRMVDRWNLYKGRAPYTGKEEGRASAEVQGESIGAEYCEEAIRART